MTPSDKEPLTPAWKRFVSVISSSLDGISAARNALRASSMRRLSPKQLPIDETLAFEAIMPAETRGKEGSEQSMSPSQPASNAADAASIRASGPANKTIPLPQVTLNIVQFMRNILQCRRKISRDNRRYQKWELLHNDRKEKVSQLEEQLDQLAISGDADSDVVREIERHLELSRAAYEESDNKLRSLRTSLSAASDDAAFELREVEIAVGTLLINAGFFGDQGSESEESEPETLMSTKNAQKNTTSTEKLPPPDSETEAKHDAVISLREKHALVRSIEADFENRSELYKEGLEQWRRRTAAGDLDMTRTELDIQWCRNYGNLGLNLWEAEIARSTAAVDVMLLNALPISYSQTSKFADDPADAAGLEDEAERAMATLDKGKVDAWLHGLEELSPIDQLIDVKPDQWDVQSLQLGESCSGIADGWIKIRLQRWDAIRKELWEETKNGMEGEYALPGSGRFVIEIDLATSKGARRVSEVVGVSELQA